MKILKLFVLISALAIASSSGAIAACEHSADTATDQAARKRELVAQKNRATARALGNKAALRAHFDFERVRLARLIDALERAQAEKSTAGNGRPAQTGEENC